MKAVAASNEVTLDFVLLTVVVKPDVWHVGIEIMNGGVCDFKVQRRVRSQPSFDQVLNDLGLAVNGNRAPTRQLVHIYVMTSTVEAEFDSVMH